MGVNIHFEGYLRSLKDYQKVIEIAKQFAVSNDMDFTPFLENDKLLERVKNDENWNYQGMTRGIIIDVNPNCDPLNFEFDSNLYIQEYCKTQFTDIGKHILIIDLLRKIEPHFETLAILDEGEYWETSDTDVLQEHFSNCFKAIEDAKLKDKLLQGPFRLENGRIIDLMS